MNGMVTGDMTRDQVVDMIMDQVNSLEINANMRLMDGYYKVSFQRMPIKEVVILPFLTSSNTKVNDHFVNTWKVDGANFVMKDPYDSLDFNESLEYGDFGK